MVKLTLTPLASGLDLNDTLQAPPDALITTRTATVFGYTFPTAGSPFPGFAVTLNGTGFTYDGTTPIDGTITKLTVQDAQGHALLVFSNFAPTSLAADLSQIAADIFGSGGVGPGPSAQMAWSHLLSGNDVITGSSGNDRGLIGIDAGNDVYNMGAGDDLVYGGSGNDTINGGDGYDVLSYATTTFGNGLSATRGIVANLATGIVTDCWGDTDIITGIEQIDGSRFNDEFFGSAARDNFVGLRGRDIFHGVGSRDVVHYETDYGNGGNRGIIADLQISMVGTSIKGAVRDGFGNLDTTYDIDRVIGTRFDDKFTGSSTNNVFAGGEGRDSYDGDAGIDLLSFERYFGDTPVGNVVVDLSRALGQVRNDGFGNIENARNIENVSTGAGNDTLTGSTGDNGFTSGQGADLMTGGGGADTFEFYGDELAKADRITDFYAAGPLTANRDHLYFYTPSFVGMTTATTVTNGPAATAAAGQFYFRPVNATLYWDDDGTGDHPAFAVVKLDGVTGLTIASFILDS